MVGDSHEWTNYVARSGAGRRGEGELEEEKELEAMKRDLMNINSV